MAVKKQKNIDAVLEMLKTLQQRRSDFMRKAFEIQKQDSEFEKLLQVSLLKLLAMDMESPTITKPEIPPNRAAYG